MLLQSRFTELKAKNRKKIKYDTTVCDWYPYALQVITGTKCDVNCIMCYWRTLKVEHHELSFDIYDELMRKCGKYLQTVLFSSMGEPLYHSRIKDIFKLTQDYGAWISMITNGGHLNEVMDILAESGQSISISVDSPEKETFEFIRRGLKFNTIMENLTKISEIREENRKNNKRGMYTLQHTFRPLPFVNINYVVMKNNIHQMKDMIRLVDALKLDGIRFLFGNVIGSPAEKLVGEIDRDDSRIFEAMEWGRENSKIKIIDQCTSKGIPLALPDEQVVCSQPWFFMLLNHDGRLQPCCKYLVPCPEDEPEGTREYGRLPTNKDFLNDIWNGENATKLRELIMENQAFPKNIFWECQNCLNFSGLRAKEEGIAPV